MRIRLEYNDTIICATECISFDSHYKIYWFIRQLYNRVNDKVKLKPFINCFDADTSGGFTLKIESKGNYTTNGIIKVVEEAISEILSLIFNDEMIINDSSSCQYPLSINLDTTKKVVYYKDGIVEDWKDSRKLDEIVNSIASRLKDSFTLDGDYYIFGKLDNNTILPSLEIQYKGSEDQSEMFYQLVVDLLNDLFHTEVILNYNERTFWWNKWEVGFPIVEAVNFYNYSKLINGQYEKSVRDIISKLSNAKYQLSVEEPNQIVKN